MNTKLLSIGILQFDLVYFLDFGYFVPVQELKNLLSCYLFHFFHGLMVISCVISD